MVAFLDVLLAYQQPSSHPQPCSTVGLRTQQLRAPEPVNVVRRIYFVLIRYTVLERTAVSRLALRLLRPAPQTIPQQQQLPSRTEAHDNIGASK